MFVVQFIENELGKQIEAMTMYLFYLKMKITIIDCCHFNARKMVEKLGGSRMMSHIYDDNDSTRDENWSA